MYLNAFAWSIPSCSLFFGFGTAWLHCFVAVTLVVFEVHEKLIHSTNLAEHYFFLFCSFFFSFLPWIGKLNYLIVWPDECQSKYTEWGWQCQARKRGILIFPVAKIHLIYFTVLYGCPLYHCRLLRSERRWFMYKYKKIKN